MVPNGKHRRMGAVVQNAKYEIAVKRQIVFRFI
jgi:hypothetical protein